MDPSKNKCTSAKVRCPKQQWFTQGNISRLPRHSILCLPLPPNVARRRQDGQCVGNARGHHRKELETNGGQYPNQPQPGIKHMGHFPKATRAVAKGQNSLYLSNRDNKTKAIACPRNTAHALYIGRCSQYMKKLRISNFVHIFVHYKIQNYANSNCF